MYKKFDVHVGKPTVLSEYDSSPNYIVDGFRYCGCLDEKVFSLFVFQYREKMHPVARPARDIPLEKTVGYNLYYPRDIKEIILETATDKTAKIKIEKVTPERFIGKFRLDKS